MKLTRLAVIIVSLIALPGLAIPSEPVGYEDMATKFFTLVSAGKSGEAVDALYKSNPYADKIADNIQQVKSSLASSEAMVGPYRGSSLILRKELGGRVAYLYYLVSYERQPLKFEFVFYRPGDKWVVQNFSFSDKILDDVRDFAKYDLMQKLQ